MRTFFKIAVPFSALVPDAAPLHAAMDEVQDLPPALDRALTGCAASYNLFSRREGTIAAIDGLDALEKIPDVFVDMPKREGNAVRPLACMGLLGLYGATMDELCEKLKIVNKVFSVRNEDGEMMFIRYDDLDALKREYENGLREFA